MNTFACRAMAWLALGWLGAAVPAQSAVWTVGAVGTGCDFTNIQAAVDAARTAPGSDTIRIARSATWTAQQLAINDTNELTLEGGYSTCSSPAPDNTKTILSGAGGDQRAVLTIRGNNAVYLRRLVIRDGDNLGEPGLGGGIDFRNPSVLEISDSDIINNEARTGGGIYAEGTATTSEVFVRDRTLIGFNEARASGGGVYAAGLEFVITGRDTTVLGNEAQGTQSGSGLGGGVRITSTDAFEAFLYVSSDGPGGLGSIHGNTARAGGGVAVTVAGRSENDSVLRLFTVFPDARAAITDNTATLVGGGLYLEPDGETTGNGDTAISNAVAVLQGAVLSGNLAPDGAAIYGSADGSFAIGAVGAFARINTVDLASFGALPCPTVTDCGLISGNVASAAGGSVVRMLEDGTFSVRRARVSGNQGAYLLRDTDGFNSVADSLIVGNTMTDELFIDQGDSSFGPRLTVSGTTVADNQIGGIAVFRIADAISLDRVLVSQPGKPTIPPGGQNVTINRVVTNDDTNFPLGLGNRRAAARFVDPARGDYRLRAGSVAVDAAPTATDSLDLIGTRRNINVPLAGGNFTTNYADIGAFERLGLLPLVLNADFNADLNQWEATQTADSAWDGTQNISGAAGSGSARVVFVSQPASSPLAVTAAGRGQCIHLPGPGTYALNGWARVEPASSPPLATRSARLTYALRYNGGAFTCENGSADVTGALVLATTSAWSRPGSPLLIEVPAAQWTDNTSLTVSLDVIGPAIGQTTGWFDGITLEAINLDELFGDSFE